jgi:hypothetical protein
LKSLKLLPLLLRSSSGKNSPPAEGKTKTPTVSFYDEATYQGFALVAGVILA